VISAKTNSRVWAVAGEGDGIFERRAEWTVATVELLNDHAGACGTEGFLTEGTPLQSLHKGENKVR